MDPMVVERKPETAVQFKCWNCFGACRFLLLWENSTEYVA
jgi:hypothetical protein